MIVDTNVVSELMRPRPDQAVVRWFDTLGGYNRARITAITATELLRGAFLLPEGKRKSALVEQVTKTVLEDFRGRIEPFDAYAARDTAAFAARRAKVGTPVSAADAMIAGICSSRGSTLATRNIKDFEGSGIELVNPWDD